ncbi:60S ribosomal protein L13 [Ustulina deusta]|nr:60S ribosomal protein L13 [Ustulina deusta]KAI3336008.1 60S ribosomal protein L13 [Ustulina deusta]
MAIKGNQQIPHNHFRKAWQTRVKCHFDQAGQKSRRRDARRAKAAAVAPRPLDRLRPVVRCPTIKYNRRARAGRGFSLAELSAAGIPRRLAPTIGISVDHRRVNLSEESLAINVQRLKAYQARLIVFPRKTKGPSLDNVDTTRSIKSTFTIEPTAPGVSEVKKAAMPKGIEGGAFRALRLARSEARLKGVREKRVRDAAEAENAKK